MLSAYDTIVLSPHLDDAALSCGGFIYQQTQAQKDVLIVTFMAGDPPDKPFSPFAANMHETWELDSAIFEQRRHEDGNASRILGADYLHKSLDDAIYRTDAETGEHFYDSNETLFGTVNEQDAAQMLPLITAVFKTLPPAELVLSPLTVGDHVDHQLVRRAAEAFYGKSLVFYEDYPYARKPNSVATLINNDRLSLEDKAVELSEEALQQKAESIAAFTSQVGMFFNGRSDIDAQIKAYANQVGGERFWHQTS